MVSCISKPALCFLGLQTLLAWSSVSEAFQLATVQQHSYPPSSAILTASSRFNNEDPHSSVSASPDLSRREAWQHAAVMTTTASGLLLPRSARAANTKTTTTNAPPLASTTKIAQVPKVRLGRSSLQVSKTIQGHWQLSGGHGKIREPDALANMDAHFKAGITTLDTADIYGPSELIVGKYVQTNPQAVPLTKFCCFRFLDEITKEEVRQRVQKVGTVV